MAKSFPGYFLTHYFHAVVSREQFCSSLALRIRQVWRFEGHVIIPVLLVREHISNRRQLPLSRVAAGSAVRSLPALPSQSPARRPWERKCRRRQPETKAGRAVAAAVKAETALAFFSVRSGFPLFLETASSVSPLSWASGLLPLSVCSPALPPCFGLSVWLAMRSMRMRWGMPMPLPLHRAGMAGLGACLVSGHIQGECGS